MSKLPKIFQTLRLPMIGALVYIVSTPQLVIAQCSAGIIGSVPALNARDADGDGDRDGIVLEIWLKEITEGLAAQERLLSLSAARQHTH